MRKRIQIDGVWFVEETTIKQDFDVTFSYEASSGIFDYSVCLNEVDDNQKLEVLDGTECVVAYLNGRDKNPEYWDNIDFLRNIRDGIHTPFANDITDLQVAELQNLLIAVSEKGWL